jgi:hypothetical protein
VLVRWVLFGVRMFVQGTGRREISVEGKWDKELQGDEGWFSKVLDSVGCMCV